MVNALLPYHVWEGEDSHCRLTIHFQGSPSNCLAGESARLAVVRI